MQGINKLGQLKKSMFSGVNIKLENEGKVLNMNFKLGATGFEVYSNQSNKFMKSIIKYTDMKTGEVDQSQLGDAMVAKLSPTKEDVEELINAIPAIKSYENEITNYIISLGFDVNLEEYKLAYDIVMEDIYLQIHEQMDAILEEEQANLTPSRQGAFGRITE